MDHSPFPFRRQKSCGLMEIVVLARLCSHHPRTCRSRGLFVSSPEAGKVSRDWLSRPSFFQRGHGNVEPRQKS